MWSLDLICPYWTCNNPPSVQTNLHLSDWLSVLVCVHGPLAQHHLEIITELGRSWGGGGGYFTLLCGKARPRVTPIHQQSSSETHEDSSHGSKISRQSNGNQSGKETLLSQFQFRLEYILMLVHKLRHKEVAEENYQWWWWWSSRRMEFQTDIHYLDWRHGVFISMFYSITMLTTYTKWS